MRDTYLPRFLSCFDESRCIATKIICEVTAPLVLAFNQLGDGLQDIWTHGCTMSCSDIANAAS
jgi:hypothetical protein